MISLLAALSAPTNLKLDELFADVSDPLGEISCTVDGEEKKAELYTVTSGYYVDELRVGIVFLTLFAQSPDMGREMAQKIFGKLVNDELARQRHALWDIPTKGQFVKQCAALEAEHKLQVQAFIDRMKTSVTSIPVQDEPVSTTNETPNAEQQ